MLRTAQSLPLHRALDAALRRRAFPPDTGSLLPGPLAATRTGLPPAGDDELQNESDHVIAATPPFAGYSPFLVADDIGGGVVGMIRRQTGVVRAGEIATSARSPRAVSSALSALHQLTSSARPTRRGAAGGAVRRDVP